MYKVSNDYRKVIYGGESDNMPLLTINDIEIPYTQISKIEISNPIIDTTSQVFYIGTFVATKITITFRNTNGVPLEGNVHLEIGSRVNGEYEYVPIGEFIIDTPTEDFYTKSQLVCMDRSVLFKPNVDYSVAIVDGVITIENLLQWLCEHFEVELGTYPNSPNLQKTIASYDNTVSGKRYISWIAEMLGGNAKMGRDGRLYIIPLKRDPVVEIDALDGKSWETTEKYHISKVRFDNGVLFKELGGEIELKDISGSNELELPSAIGGLLPNYTINGKTSKKILTGKNKYNATRTPQTYDGLTYEATTSEIKVNGNALYDGDWYYNFNQMTLPDGTYTLCVELVSGEFFNNKSLEQSPLITCQIGNYNYAATLKIPINSSLNVTKGYFTFELPLDSHNEFKIGFSQINKDTIANDAIFKYQIIKGNQPDYDFEPYIGGITITGKNLFDYTKVIPEINGLSSTINADGGINTKGTLTKSYTRITPTSDITDILEDGETYTLSQQNLNNKVYIEMQAKKPDGSITYIGNMNRTSTTFVVDKTTYEQYIIYIVTNTVSVVGTINTTNYYQLEKGDKYTGFEPYPTFTEKSISDISIQVNEQEPIPIDLQGNTLGDTDILSIDSGVIKINDEIELGNLEIQLIDGNNNIKAITDIETTTSAKYLTRNKVYNTLDLRTENLFLQETDFEDRIQNIYDLVKDFEVWSLKCENQGDPSLDSWDIVTYDVDGKKYNTFYDSTITYEMTIMSKVSVSIPTKQVQQTTNVIAQDPNIEIKKISVEVDQLNGKITETATKTETLNTTVNNNYQEITNKFNNYIPQSEYVSFTQQMVETLENSKKTFATTQQLVDGSVTMVKTGTTTIDIDGVTVDKSDSVVKSTHSPQGINVVDKNTNEQLLFAGYDETLQETIVRTNHLNVSRYLIISSLSRLERYNPVGEKPSIGAYWVGD